LNSQKVSCASSIFNCSNRTILSKAIQAHNYFFYYYYFFGVLRPVARTLSRLLEEPSLATIFNVFIYIYFAAACFSPRWPSSGGIHSYFREVLWKTVQYYVLIQCFMSLTSIF
jgi:hypothetical protein